MKKEFTKEIIDDLANKLIIGLSDEENQMVLEEFANIDANIDLINQIDNISDVEPMTHTLDDFTFELREDIPEESVPIDDLLKNCDRYEGREIEVPKVVG